MLSFLFDSKAIKSSPGAPTICFTLPTSTIVRSVEPGGLQASHQEKETLNDTRSSRQKENYKVVGGLGIRGILILVPQ